MRVTTTSGTVDDRAVVLPYAMVLGPGVTLGRDWTATDAWTRVLAHTVKKELVVRTAITRAVGSLVLVVSVTGIVFVTGMRTKSPVRGERRPQARPSDETSGNEIGWPAGRVRLGGPPCRTDIRPLVLDAGGGGADR